MLNRFLIVGLFALILSMSAIAQNLRMQQFGIDDSLASASIIRTNELSSLRSKGDYKSILILLEKDLIHFKNNEYATQRIKNEIADINSNNILDIENAIAIDSELLISKISRFDESKKFVPTHRVAQQKVLADEIYVNSYISISEIDLLKIVKSRLDRNLYLLNGVSNVKKNSYERNFLENYILTVKNDISSTPVNSSDRFTILSRLIRAEYELSLISQSPVFAYKYLLLNELKLINIDLSEIDFLQLTNYLITSFKQTDDIRLAEMALDTIYRPYINLRNTENRWRYNKLINEYITLLIDENFKVGRFDEAFYYISLNKSRMLLEERLAFSRTKGESGKISDLAVNDGIPRTAFGLPDKAWFKQQIAATPQFLDFYVGGAYKPVTVALAGKGSRGSSSVMPLNSRNAGLLVTGEPIDTFQDDALYSTKIEGGRVVGITKLSGSQLGTLKAQMEKSYDSITEREAVSSAPELQRIVTKARPNDVLMVSSDKWMSKHPMDFHLGSKVVRSVNFFTAESSVKLNKLNVTGFFNPLLAGGEGSLAGADKEAVNIKNIIPSASIIRREGATLGALQQAESANVIHLSMHGQFNPDDATQSKLFFAGAKFDGSFGDSKALYAADMSKIAALSNRDLIFAAACQTGLSAADRSNENELIGMLRPLTANRNRNVILSLWSVSDEVTGEFVQAFYQRLAATQEITTSFHFAQDQIKAKHPHPFYWAAFYLSQAK